MEIIQDKEKKVTEKKYSAEYLKALIKAYSEHKKKTQVIARDNGEAK